MRADTPRRQCRRLPLLPTAPPVLPAPQPRALVAPLAYGLLSVSTDSKARLKLLDLRVPPHNLPACRRGRVAAAAAASPGPSCPGVPVQARPISADGRECAGGEAQRTGEFGRRHRLVQALAFGPNLAVERMPPAPPPPPALRLSLLGAAPRCFFRVGRRAAHCPDGKRAAEHSRTELRGSSQMCGPILAGRRSQHTLRLARQW